jgi:hypothetical protein
MPSDVGIRCLKWTIQRFINFFITICWFPPCLWHVKSILIPNYRNWNHNNRKWFDVSLYLPSFTTNKMDVPSVRSTVLIALTIERFLFSAVLWSNPINFALLKLWIDKVYHYFPKTHVSVPPYKILISYLSGRNSRFIHVLRRVLLILTLLLM